MPQYIFLFPGQGSQYIGMAKDFCDSDSTAMELIERAGQRLGRDLTSLMFKGPEPDLTLTSNLQPAICAASAVCLRAVTSAGFSATAAAGHSLGELTALCAAGAIDFDTMIALAEARGRLMQAAADKRPGAMLAVLGLRREAVEKALASLNPTAGVVGIANLNAPEQIVLSGEVQAIEAAEKAVRAAGASRAVPLKVSGPWHSPLMAEARDAFGAVLRDAPIRDAAIDVYANFTATPERKAAEIRENLAAQITSPVKWTETIERIAREHPDAVLIEVGPGRVLKGLVLRIDKSRVMYNVEDRRSLDALLKACKPA